MASLVLTAVGTALGGPIGGAIGAIIGQQIDQNILFKPKDREGPRLQELAVQTSSYGSQIPRIYGRMRVAGTVIWATDIKETRSSQGGGKGRPSTTTFSYSACLAVALSSRDIKNIGRIWADGNIFRGSAGDFKTSTGFRFYPGTEDQPVDSLIGAAEGAGRVPAHRGLAIAVFEDMDLTDYGNRIPSLTFEIIADDGSVQLADIIDDISSGATASTVGQQLHGFAASGQDRRSALRSIVDSFSLSFTAGPEAILVKPRISDNAGQILSVGMNIVANNDGQREEPPEYQILPETKLPRQYSLRYYDPARDFQSGMQNVFRPGNSRAIANQDFPAAIAAGGAKAIAQEKLWALYQERSTARLHILRSAQSARPGSLIELNDSNDLWWVRNWELKNGAIELSLSKAATQISSVAASTDQGRAVAEMDALAGPTRVVLTDLPFAIDAPTQVSNIPRLYASAAGNIGWRNAQLYSTGLDGGINEYIGQIRSPAILGTIPAVLGEASPHVIDRINSIEVDLHNQNMDLNDADTDQLLVGKNIAAVGAEMLQYANALPLGDGRYRLSHLIRGLGGTEHEIGQHQGNEDFVLLDAGAMIEIDSRHYTLSQPASFMAVGRDDIDPVIANVAATGRALKPWSPVHAGFKFNAAGDIEIGWTRRSRAGLAWLDNVDVPLGEEFERYRVVIEPENLSGFDSIIDVTTSSYSIPAATVQGFRNAGAAVISVHVSQVGQHGLSDPRGLSIPL